MISRQKLSLILKTAFAACAVSIYYKNACSVFLSLVCFILLYFFFNKTSSCPKDRVCSAVSFVLAVFLSLGEAPYGIKVRDYIFIWIGFYFLFQAVLVWIYRFLDTHPRLIISGKPHRIRPLTFFAGVCMGSFLFWLLYFLTYYPGILTNDSYKQLLQAVGLAPYSNHHPWIHTLVLKACYRLGMALFHNREQAIATYTILQMLLFSGIYSYILTLLYKEHVSTPVLLVFFGFYVLFPVNAHYTVYVGKDSYFSAIVLLYIVLLWQISRIYRAGKPLGWRCFVSYGFVSFLVCTFRGNGYYAFLLCIPVSLFLFRTIWKKMLLCIASVVLCVTIFKGPVMNHFSVSQPDILESLAIPLQQIAGVITEKGTDSLTEGQKELLNQIIDVETVADIYFRQISDPIKDSIRDKGNLHYLEENLDDYLKLYLSLGLKNPRAYMEAFIWQTQGYYAPNIRYWVSHTPYVYEDERFPVKLTPQLPKLFTDRIQEHLQDYPEVPLYSLLWYISAYVWVFIIAFGYALHKKLPPLPFIFIAGIWVTLLIAAPVYAEFRYAYPLILATPFLLSTALLPEQKTD